MIASIGKATEPLPSRMLFTCGGKGVHHAAERHNAKNKKTGGTASRHTAGLILLTSSTTGESSRLAISLTTTKSHQTQSKTTQAKNGQRARFGNNRTAVSSIRDEEQRNVGKLLAILQ